MTPEQKQLLRDALLAGLVVSMPLSLPISTLQNIARAAGFEVARLELVAHLDYLTDKGFIKTGVDEVSAGVVRYKATAAAVEYCERSGLC
jgi:hypothetical protein